MNNSPIAQNKLFFLSFLFFLASLVSSREILSAENYIKALSKIHSLLDFNDALYISAFPFYAQSTNNLASLYFGTNCFTPAQTGLISPPTFAQSIVKPHVRVREAGALFVLWGKKYIHPDWALGGRIMLPVKQMAVTNKTCGNYFTLDRAARVIQQNVNELLAAKNPAFYNGRRVCAPQQVGDSILYPCAYRLDLLSQLNYSVTGVESIYPITNYHDTSFAPASPITIYNQDSTQAQQTPVTARAVSPGSTPQAPYALSRSQVAQMEPVTASGSVGPDGSGYFSSYIDYTPIATALPAQQELWILPTYEPDDYPKDLAALDKAGFCTHSCKRGGVSALATDLFVGHHFSDRFYMEYIAGMDWPTGDIIKGNNVFYPALGTNGHYIVRLETQGIYQVSRWFALRPDVEYDWILPAQERVAVPEKIGSRSWQHLALITDTIFTLNKISGFFTMGYKFDAVYAFKQDKVHLHNRTSQGHTVHGALLLNGNSFSKFSLAGSYTFAGKRIAKTALGSLGITLYF